VELLLVERGRDHHLWIFESKDLENVDPRMAERFIKFLETSIPSDITIPYWFFFSFFERPNYYTDTFSMSVKEPKRVMHTMITFDISCSELFV
jgi:hypothetical protein